MVNIKKQMITNAVKDVKKGKPWRWECKLVQPLWKSVWRQLQKAKNRTTKNPAVSFLSVHQRTPHPCTYCSNYNSQKIVRLEVHQLMTGNEKALYICSRILFSCKEKIMIFFRKMDRTREHYTQSGYPDPARQLARFLIGGSQLQTFRFMFNLECQQRSRSQKGSRCVQWGSLKE